MCEEEVVGGRVEEQGVVRVGEDAAVKGGESLDLQGESSDVFEHPGI